MRTMIAVPCMDTVHTLFMTSLLSLRKAEGTEISVASCSLVYDARHDLALRAMNMGFDRVLWLDSDMRFDPDLMERLSADLDDGHEFVSAVYFTRKTPCRPCVYGYVDTKIRQNGVMYPAAENITEIPDGIFEIAGCGFGAVMMTTDLIRHTGPLPFFPEAGFGEDLTFCRKARAAGAKLMCDGRIHVDHIGTSIINEKQWRR